MEKPFRTQDKVSTMLPALRQIAKQNKLKLSRVREFWICYEIFKQSTILN